MMQRMRWQGGDEEDNGGGAKQRVRLEGGGGHRGGRALSGKGLSNVREGPGVCQKGPQGIVREGLG